MTVTVFDPKGPRQAVIADLPGLLASSTGTIWVDLTGPSDDDVQLMLDVFRFHPLAVEDTRNFRQRPKVEEYADYLFIILNPVTQERDEPVFRELDVFVGRNYVVTVHPGDEPTITEAHTRLDRAGVAPPMSPSYLLYVLVDTVVDGYFPILDLMEEEIEKLGDAILTNPRQDQLNRLFQLKGALLDLWRVVWPQREILSNLSHHDLPLIDQDAVRHYLRDVSDHLMWIADMITTFRDTLTSIVDLYMSAVSNRLNRVVNRLTVFTVVIGLLGMIGSFYGMNFAQTWPSFSSGWGVPFVLALMISLAGVLLYVLRKLDWY